jgi:UDP-galactopyranose mutase
MAELEDELLVRAHVVFTGGMSIYEHKRAKHTNIHPFPSSVDVAHFAKARTIAEEPADQAHIAGPRIGYAGVIDERFDVDLVRGIAEARPDWHFVYIGPVVKIDPETLPRAPNIHYLGSKPYAELPAYLAGWDVALLPFARNDSTRFISPTKTPEYLAAGRRVVSTSIRDVVRVYGDGGLVRIADEPSDCVAAIEASLRDGLRDSQWLRRVDEFLGRSSWDQTFRAMWQLVEAADGEVGARRAIRAAAPLVKPFTAPHGVPAEVSAGRAG